MNEANKWWLIVGGATLFFLSLLYVWSGILTPFVCATLLAYLTNPLVEKMLAWKVPRTGAVVVVLGLLLCVLLLLLFAVLPLLKQQIYYLFTQLPQFVVVLQERIWPWLNTHLGGLTKLGDIDSMDVKQTITSYWREVVNALGITLNSISNSGVALLGGILDVLLVPVALFYLLRDWPHLMRGLQNLLPRRMLSVVCQLSTQCSNVLSAFFRGQLLVMATVAVCYTIGLACVGLHLTLLIGVTAGLLSIVPYLGFIIGLIAALLASLFQFHDTVHLLYVLLVFGLVHVLEGTVLVPWLVGNKIGLHPLVVIFAILAGGQSLGFIGVLLALPMAAVLMVLLRYFYQQYRASTMYKADSI